MHPITRLTALALVTAGALAGPAAAASASSSPSVTATTPTHVGQTSAQFNGTVNPNGSTTSFLFQYGLTTGYGANTAVHNVGHGTKAVAVKATGRSLIPGTVYHFRIFAVNSHGIAVGRDHTFKTAGPPPPGASTGAASSVGVNSATLTGVINPNGAVTGYEFQYGITTAYGSQTPAATVPSGSAPVTVSAALAGLQQNQVFHYRLVAFHGSVAISYGADAVLMTEPRPRDTAKVTASTKPGRDRHAPFVFTTTGKIAGPASIAPMFDCNGQVAVRYLLGSRRVGFVVVPVAADCSFSAQAAFAHKPGHGKRTRQVRLRVLVYFRGNGYLKPRLARTEHVTLG